MQLVSWGSKYSADHLQRFYYCVGSSNVSKTLGINLVFKVMSWRLCTVQGVSEWTDKSKWSLTDKDMQVIFCFKVVLISWDRGILEITTNFYEILIERPLLDPMQVTFSFDLVLLNFAIILVYFSFACKLIWLYNYYEWQFARWYQHQFYFLKWSLIFVTLKKWLVTNLTIHLQ